MAMAEYCRWEKEEKIEKREKTKGRFRKKGEKLERVEDGRGNTGNFEAKFRISFGLLLCGECVCGSCSPSLVRTERSVGQLLCS